MVYTMYMMIDKAILKFKWLNYKQKIEQSSLHSTECVFCGILKSLKMNFELH